MFKKIRRQGYRRTGGHRQMESVLRVTGLEGAGKSEKWDGQVDLTPRAELVARSRGLATAASAASAAALTPPRVHVDDVVLDPHPGPIHRGTVVEHADALVEDPDVTAAATARKTPAKKVAKAADAGALVEPPTSEVQEDAPQTRKPAAKKAPAKKAAAKTAEAKAPAKKAAAKKTPAKPKK